MKPETPSCPATLRGWGCAEVLIECEPDVLAPERGRYTTQMYFGFHSAILLFYEL